MTEREIVARELGRGIEYHDLIDSTQDRARSLADEGSGPWLVVANAQRAGRGTRGRTWHAPAGTALLASWLMRPAPAEPALFTLLASVAVARALESLGAPRVSVKWPNDVLLDGRKIAGLLSHATTGAEAALVLGIGINVAQQAADLPEELRGTATSLAEAGVRADRLVLLVRLDAEIDRIAAPSGRPAALAEWRSRAPLLGRRVEVRRPGEPVLAGRASDLDDDGALIVETTYGPQRIVAGEVIVG